MIQIDGEEVTSKCMACGKLLTQKEKHYELNNKIIICEACYKEAQEIINAGGNK